MKAIIVFCIGLTLGYLLRPWSAQYPVVDTGHEAGDAWPANAMWTSADGTVRVTWSET